MPQDPNLPPGTTNQDVSGEEPNVCETCEGEGEVSILTLIGTFKKNIECPDCEGSGQSQD